MKKLIFCFVAALSIIGATGTGIHQANKNISTDNVTNLADPGGVGYSPSSPNLPVPNDPGGVGY